MKIFETMMLICFGAAWPFSIYKSIVSRDTGGKSLLFLITLQVGYLTGILFKVTEFMMQQGTEIKINANLYLYILNLIMVTIDECLYLRNRRTEKARSKDIS